MSAFSPSAVVLHRAGSTASAVLLVGSEFEITLPYLDGSGTPRSLTGWALGAKAELQTGEYGSDGELRALHGEATLLPVAPPVFVSPADPSMFTLSIRKDLLPVAQRNVAADAEALPTVLAYVRFVAPEPEILTDQIRVALGFRRGYGSL